MTPEEKSLLERTYKMAEDNNAILRGMRRAGRFGTVIRVLYWLVIIGATLGAYYYLQPYLVSTMNMVSKAQNAIEQMNGTVNQAQSALNAIKLPGTK